MVEAEGGFYFIVWDPFDRAEPRSVFEYLSPHKVINDYTDYTGHKTAITTELQQLQ